MAARIRVGGRESRRPHSLQARAHPPEAVEGDAFAGDGAAPRLPRLRLDGPAPPVQEEDVEVSLALRGFIAVQGLHLFGQEVPIEGGDVEVSTRVEAR
jgi:hypothetical protein